MNYTVSAKRVIIEAENISEKFRHGYIGTEHLLLGLINVKDSVASKVLVNAGIVYPEVENLIREQIAPETNVLVRDKDGKWQHKDHGYG